MFIVSFRIQKIIEVLQLLNFYQSFFKGEAFLQLGYACPSVRTYETVNSFR